MDVMPLEFLDQLKSQQWNRWMTQPVPMLGDISPTEASRTPAGRRKLDELLAFYERMSGSHNGGLNANIPPRYARWKLGYGPGSAEEFSREEAIFNMMENNPSRATDRTERHTQRLEKKKAAIWIPRRCEVPGCTKRGDDVKNCAKCKCAFYCGREHQAQDWDRHKLDCKTLRTTGSFLQPRFYVPSRELEKYPLQCFPVSSDASNTKKCFICHSGESEVDITFTSCCNLPVCDNSHEYQMFSYSRDFCERSHSRYTACGRHMDEEHAGDWRECEQCNEPEEGARPYKSTNGFCATPCLEKFIPQGSMITFGCSATGCKNRMIPGHSGYSWKSGGTYCEAHGPHGDL